MRLHAQTGGRGGVNTVGLLSWFGLWHLYRWWGAGVSRKNVHAVPVLNVSFLIFLSTHIFYITALSGSKHILVLVPFKIFPPWKYYHNFLGFKYCSLWFWGFKPVYLAFLKIIILIINNFKNLSFLKETSSFKVTSPEYVLMDGCLSALTKRYLEYLIFCLHFLLRPPGMSCCSQEGKKQTKLHTQTQNPVGDKSYIIKNVSKN